MISDFNLFQYNFHGQQAPYSFSNIFMQKFLKIKSIQDKIRLLLQVSSVPLDAQLIKKRRKIIN